MKIAVVGLGLIGGSIFKRLTKEGFDVIAISSSQVGDKIYSDYEMLSECDVVFVATPMNTVLNILEKLSSVLNPTTLVTDVSSLKSFLIGRDYPFNFIPSHPMAGTEFKGYDNSFETLFDGAKWVITPFDSNQTNDVLEDLIIKMGATPIYASPKEHDIAVSLISHAPMVLAQALFKSVQDNDLALKLASSGFRDMTRLAMSNPEMAMDMVELNSDNIQQALLRLYSSVGDLIENYNEPLLNDLSSKRAKMYKEGKNIL